VATGQVDSVFNDRIDDLQRLSGLMATAQTGQGQRAWMVPSTWQGNPLDVSELHNPAFDRSGVNASYQNVHASADGSVGAAGSLKLQLDYMSIMERSFRSRHATGLRCLMHTAARHAGHSHSQGVFAAVRRIAQDILQAGGEGA
jgi:hypothetical protein